MIRDESCFETTFLAKTSFKATFSKRLKNHHRSEIRWLLAHNNSSNLQ